jgi:hypothetical protein
MKRYRSPQEPAQEYRGIYTLEKNITVWEETKTEAKEGTEVSKTAIGVIIDIRGKEPQSGSVASGSRIISVDADTTRRGLLRLAYRQVPGKYNLFHFVFIAVLAPSWDVQELPCSTLFDFRLGCPEAANKDPDCAGRHRQDCGAKAMASVVRSSPLVFDER